MSFPWGVEERQGDYQDVVYVTVPEYQPSSATLNLGAPQLYKPSRKAENIAVGTLAFDAMTIALIAVPVGIFAIWFLIKKKKKRKKKR